MEIFSAIFLVSTIALPSTMKGLAYYEGYLTPVSHTRLNFEYLKSAVFGVNQAITGRLFTNMASLIFTELSFFYFFIFLFSLIPLCHLICAFLCFKNFALTQVIYNKCLPVASYSFIVGTLVGQVAGFLLICKK